MSRYFRVVQFVGAVIAPAIATVDFIVRDEAYSALWALAAGCYGALFMVEQRSHRRTLKIGDELVDSVAEYMRFHLETNRKNRPTGLN